MSDAAATRVASPLPAAAAAATVFPILLAIAFSHMLNDMIQLLLPAIYPMLKQRYSLSFAQIGLITLTFQITASLLQPWIGAYTDRRPMPYSLPVGMLFSLAGLLLLSSAHSFASLIVAAATIGVGSSIFHPESSRVARMASGGRFGMAQSIFQVGGNAGQSLGPLMAAYIILPYGQGSVAWFSLAAILAMTILSGIGRWYARALSAARARPRKVGAGNGLSARQVRMALGILVVLIFSKYFYLASLNSYYTFYLIHRFGVSVQDAQLHLFAFLFAVATGTLIGGPVGDRIGRKLVIWVSILGVLPFTLALPHANLLWTGVLSVVIGLVLSSAFSAIIVYAQELVPGKVGTIAGVFFGFAFGLGGLGAAFLGWLADQTSIGFVYQLCAFLPVLGILTAFLPNVEAAIRLDRKPA